MKIIETENKNYLKYVSEYMLLESGLSMPALIIWAILNLQYRKHKYQAKDWLHCYQCYNEWLMEKCMIKDVRTLRKFKNELVDKGVLFSEQVYGNQGNWYVPLDPADSDYRRLVSAITLYENKKEIRKIKWAMPEEIKKAVRQLKADKKKFKIENEVIVVTEESEELVGRLNNYLNQHGWEAKAA